MKVHVESYGCSANIADAEMISGLLSQKGYKVLNNDPNSDLNVIVTCTVKDPTSNKMVKRIKALSSTGKPLIIAGCMPKTELDKILQINDQASLLDPGSVHLAEDAAKAALAGEKFESISSKRSNKVLLPRLRSNPVVHIAEVSQGCLSKCTFCQVKFARGGLVSYRPLDIVKEIEQAVVDGCREIWLTSQDIGCYGKDIKTSLPELLNIICDIDGDFMVRVGMMNPMHLDDIIDDLITSYMDPKIFKFLHIPVQSGSDEILKLMKRMHSVNDFELTVKKFRNAFPNISLSTDINVGFPEETDLQFQETLDLVRRINFDTVNVSRFGSRPGTEAYSKPILPHKIVKERSKLMHTVAKSTSHSRNKIWMGWKGKSTIVKNVKNAQVARNPSYKPVILKTNLPLGSSVNTEIVNYSANCLVGTLI